MGKRRQRRAWSDDEKRKICAQARMPGLSVSQVARRYDVNANLVFKWLRDPRFAPAETNEVPPGFLPVTIVEDRVQAAPASHADNRIEIDLVGGHRLRVSGSLIPRCWRG